MVLSCAVVDLGPACVNLTGIRANDRNLVNIVITRKGQPVDLTGMTLTAQARKKAADPDPPALVARIALIDATLGQVTMQWPGADVATLLGTATKWSGVWDLQVDDGVDLPLTVAAGTLDATWDVTR